MLFLIKQLLIEYCASLSHPVFLFFGYTMNHYTEQVVHSIINACGFSTATYHSPTHPISIPNTSITVGSPLGELTSRELCLYCHYLNIRYSTQFSFLSNPGPSVYRLSEGIFEKESCPRHGGVITRWLRLDAAYRDGDVWQASALWIDGSGAGEAVQTVWRVGKRRRNLMSRWSNEAICGRCQFLIKEDTSGVLQTINSHSFVCYFNKHQLIIILFISN